ncbi:MAG: DUF805 domain-containing protein [Chloroherpetonaceae bacterium]|nr:DUF805 domain-containing protein [Chthonomonadaceae bacterium]MDW8207324.1 DUF805 domain-containing protein [Chloroherpetonaceae bacterium]
MRWYFTALRKYAVFRGRARRREYWMFFLWNAIFGFLISRVDVLLGTWDEESRMGQISSLYSLAMVVPNFAIIVRRLHDIGKSGWNVLWLLFALFMGRFLLVTSFPGADTGSEHKDFMMLMIMLLSVSVVVATPIWFLMMLVQDSQPGTNRYGPNPKAIQAS